MYGFDRIRNGGSGDGTPGHAQGLDLADRPRVLVGTHGRHRSPNDRDPNDRNPNEG